MLTIRIPSWISCEYVTISTAPFLSSRGKKLPPQRELTAYRIG